jgi:hypothetical protein
MDVDHVRPHIQLNSWFFLLSFHRASNVIDTFLIKNVSLRVARLSKIVAIGPCQWTHTLQTKNNFWQEHIIQCIQRYAAFFISIILTATAVLVDWLFTQVNEPYHTSILTDKGWIMELLSGHPNWIQCELGVSHDIFAALISELWGMEHVNSKYVSLEEQLGIFLYMSMTGLTIRNVGEQFQR